MYYYIIYDLREVSNSKFPVKSLKFETLAAAIDSAFTTMHVISTLLGYDYENQGDQLLSFPERGEAAGYGMFAIKVYDGDGNEIEFND